MSTVYSVEQTEKADEIRRGIKAAIKDPSFGWRVGCRNNMAVDLSCALWVLGYKDYKSQYEWAYINLDLELDELHDLSNRLKVIENYLDNWDCDNAVDGVFAKMLDPDEWIAWSKK